MSKFTCHTCNKSVEHQSSRIRKFCSIPCRSKGYKMSDKAKEMARKRRIYMNKKFPISSEQATINGSKSIRPTGQNHYNWNGGKKINTDGYRCIKHKEHPKAQNGYVSEHILVMEKNLGRFLYDGEIVHHIDGNKLNNSIDNLKLFQNTAEHTRLHWEQHLWRQGSKSRP